LVIAVALSVVILGSAWWFARVSTIYCYIQYANCSPELVVHLKELQGKRLLLQDFEAAVSERISSNPDVTLANIQKTFPDTLIITLHPQKVAYVFKELASNQSLIITSAGTVVMTDLRADWPVYWITPSMMSEVQQDLNLEINLHQQLQLVLTSLPATGWEIQAISLPDWQTVQLELANQLTVLLPLAQSETELSRVKDLLKGISPDQLTQIEEIDVRYKLPVLRKTRTIPRHDSQ
jgi:cell division septal protein FtsQ